jgi:putative nucleotidyltransferase with HDIG domain
MAEIRFRDPVHNFIRFGLEEVRLINLDVLQRLRGIQQLAMASLVYPGALHTRFDHTLGVAHVAGEMADALGLDAEERTFVRQAALLHDIGHGPFSHVSEYALDRFADRSALPPDLKKEKIHEVITGHLIRNHPTIVQRLGQETCNRVAQLLSEGVGDPVLRTIVSGPLDSDKQDYLLRDSLFAGVNYGVYDIHQLQRSLVCEKLADVKELMIRTDGVHAVEQFIMAKYYLTTMVYRHKIRQVTDQMIIRAIILGIESDGIKDLEKLYRFEQKPKFYENYLKWNDAKFLDRFGENGKKSAKCTALIQRLLSRSLLKRVFYAPVKEFDADAKERLMSIEETENHLVRQQIETEIAKALAAEFNTTVEGDFTILHTYQIKSVRESSRNDEASILVAKPGRMPGKFEDESVLFSSINERFSDEYVEVYAPVSWSDPAERARHLNAVTPIIKEIISTRARSIQLTMKI